ncbi:ABC transporter ATP-binding protein [Agromyces aerolatus]|uniref:ABC transporter ATP-binding protein n=1 Tax=Agromyces sp. LY-1074 TaxID=3074080 RepID=UPI002865555B|nr:MULTISPECIES: ABC transporter ATP-binding protein [unclassified Agromyces]MDR5700858.1 ABC transporter ATP-binding protein [Agromyces sp. LY-1074]MDR5707481.1 ABC transporter ATP-binding protein [Agromyces sp. LY-1358]
MTALLEVQDLRKHFPLPYLERMRTGAKTIGALDGVSFSVQRGETVGIVGESGCGKSTLARTLVGLEHPTGGNIQFDGVDTDRMSRTERRAFRAKVQMVFQDPFASLDPRMRVRRIIGEGWRAQPSVVPPARRGEHAARLMEAVSLPVAALERFPHQFSGGQRQRIGIARALAVQPELLVCDEPTSGLDVSVQAQVLELLRELTRERSLTMLFIGHDLPVIRSIADRVIVMYLGKIVEIGPAEQIFTAPRHPYTKALLSATPNPLRALRKEHSERIELRGDVPSPMKPPSGCRFRTRCWKAQDVCASVEPRLDDQVDSVACHFPEPAPAPRRQGVA